MPNVNNISAIPIVQEIVLQYGYPNMTSHQLICHVWYVSEVRYDLYRHSMLLVNVVHGYVYISLDMGCVYRVKLNYCVELERVSMGWGDIKFITLP